MHHENRLKFFMVQFLDSNFLKSYQKQKLVKGGKWTTAEVDYGRTTASNGFFIFVLCVRLVSWSCD